MDKKLLRYRAEFDINKGKLYYLTKVDDSFVEEGIVEIFENNDKDYKVLARLNLYEKNTVIQSLILEKHFLDEQENNAFYEYAKADLSWYLNRLKFISRQHSVLLDTNGEVTDYKGNKYRYTRMAIGLAAHSSRSTSLEGSVCVKVGQAKSSLLAIDEYIEKHITISGFQDSILRLISLATLYELIRADLTVPGSGYILDEQSVNEYQLIKKSTGSEVSRIEVLAISARNLIAHGNVSHLKTIKPLNKFWKLPPNTNHKFDRKNRKHMDLIVWASERYSYVINTLIEAML